MSGRGCDLWFEPGFPLTPVFPVRLGIVESS